MDLKALYQRAKNSFQKMIDFVLRVLSVLESRRWVRGLLFVSVLAITGVLFFLLNLYTPMLMDDYDYLYSWATGERIDSIGDVLRSQLVHYRTTNGRLLTHVFVQSTLLLGKKAFCVVNTAMFLILLLEIYFLSRRRKGCFEWMLLLCESLILMTMIPFFGMVFLWQTGACNYLWGTVLALLPVVMLRAVREYGVLAANKTAAVVFPVIGFFAGWTNENTACGIVALVFAALALDWLEGRRVYKRLWMMWIAQCAGLLCMLLAPGNAIRAQAFEQKPFLIELAGRFVNITAYGMCYAGVLFAGVVFLSILLRGKDARIGYAALLMFGALGASYALLGSPVLSDRTFAGVIALVLSAMMVVLADFIENTRFIGAAKLLAMPALTVFLVYTGYHGIKDVQAFNVEIAELTSTIELAAESGQEEIRVEPVLSQSRFTMSMLIEEEADAWPNSTLERYYGIRIIGE